MKFISVLVPSILGLSCSSLSIAELAARRVCKPEIFKWSHDQFTVNVSRYGGNSSDKSLVIIPPTGRTNYIDRKYAESFCEAGYDTYILDSWTGDIETTTELEIHQRFYSNAQIAIATVLKEIKSPYIGLLGTSVGGLHAAIAANYQDRLQAVFVIAGGIPIAEVIVDSNQEAMINLRKDRQKRYGFKTGLENIQAIEKVFELEPQKLTAKYKERDLGVSIGLKDETVPTATQKQLQEYWQPKKVITFSNNHFWTIVKTWLFRSDEVVQFFEDSYRAHQNLK